LRRRGGARVGIFGLGYVGCVNAGCLAARGHRVAGVDVNAAKVEEIRRGGSPIVEPGLAALLRRGIRSGSLTVTTDPAEAVARSSVSLVCVGTPSDANGRPSIEGILEVCRQIGEALRSRRGRAYHLVAIRSTSLPGTVAKAARILERASGLREGREFGVASHPEFLREGTAVADFNRPPYTIAGVRRERDAAVLKRLYAGIPGPFVVTEVEAAEMIKYASNAYHAVKVTFANEVGILCRAAGIDAHRVMEIFCRDTKLNVSPAYLRPGFAFGGSCLPKDLRALGFMARSHHVETPLLASTMASNDAQVRAVTERIAALGSRRVGFLGLAFKSGTDDLRESPLVRVVEWLLGKGYEVRIFDPNVNLARLIGANKAFIEREIPHIASLMAESPEEVVAASEVLVVGNRDASYLPPLKKLRRGQRVLDLVRLIPPGFRTAGRCEGIYG
jgi:GDP-mannose 6-dehydrogenase